MLKSEYSGPYWSKRQFPGKYATDQLTRDIIHNKRGSDNAAERIAKRMANDLQVLDWDFKLIIPVPNHKSDQSNAKAPLLAKKLSVILSIPYQNDILVRICKSDRYRRYHGIFERREAAKKDYRINDYSQIKDRNVLLIDDIITSGATTENCRDLLYENGAKIVYAFCAARTLR